MSILWSGVNGVLANRKGVVLGDGVWVAVSVIVGVWVEGGLGVKEGEIVGVELLA